MQRPIVLPLLLSLCTALTPPAAGQALQCTVVTLRGETIAPCTIGPVVGSIVSLDVAGGVRLLHVDSIASLTREVDSQLWTSAGYGAVIGVVVGGVIGVANYRQQTESMLAGMEVASAGLEGALLGGVAGFTAGLLVGAALSADEKYEFTGLSTAQRDSLLHGIRWNLWSSPK
jgi:hypothetical protein